MQAKTTTVGLIVVVAAALAPSVAAGPRAPSAETLSLLAVGDTFELVDNGKQGVGVGDVFASGGRLYSWHGRGRGPLFGRLDVLCTALTADGVRSHCSITAAAPGGRIETVGLLTGESNKLAVIGGTGRYRGVRGELAMRSIGGDKLALVFRLRTANS